MNAKTYQKIFLCVRKEISFFKYICVLTLTCSKAQRNQVGWEMRNLYLKSHTPHSRADLMK